MGEAGSRRGKSPLRSAAGATELRRRYSFTRTTRRTGHVFLQRSGNRLPREKISSRWIHSEIFARRACARAARFLPKAIRREFSREPARPGQAHLLVSKS